MPRDFSDSLSEMNVSAASSPKQDVGRAIKTADHPVITQFVSQAVNPRLPFEQVVAGSEQQRVVATTPTNVTEPANSEAFGE